MLKKIIKKAFNILGFEIRSFTKQTFNPEEQYLKNINGNISYYETPIGNYYLPNDNYNDLVVNIMKKGEFFESIIIETASEFIKPNTAVLDVGAHFGQMSLEFSKFTGDEGKVYSFEAEPFIYSILEKNIIANNIKNIKPIFGAVFDKIGVDISYPKPDFKRFSAYGSYGVDLNSQSGRKIQSITIDSLQIQEPISFMKVDIQGSDLFALIGAVETIKKNKMPIIFEFEQQFQDEFKTSFQDYIDFVISIDYKFEKSINDINFLIVPKN